MQAPIDQKIQFPWQRGAAPHPGGLSDTGTPDSDDTGNECSGTWVRVAEALAGPNWGSLFTPRLGDEVLVEFIDGDIDRPVITGSLYNGDDLPPYSAGVDSSINHSGTLSGIHSHGLDSPQDYNQWVIDDTPAQLRMRLASSTAASQLNLGHLIQQRPESAQRGSVRGQGFELRTDAWGAGRGGEGVFISTTARPGQGAGVTATQMDASEAVAQMKAAHALTKALCGAATQQSALTSHAAQQGQTDFIAALDPAQKGKYIAPVNGQTAQQPHPGTRDLNPEKPVEKFTTPLILLDSPASIGWTTPASTALFAGQHLHWTSHTDLHLAAAHTLASVAGGATTLFTHSGGIQAIAANGSVSLQAHTGALEILADQAVTVTSVNGNIEIRANQKIVVQAGQSSITLEGGNITLACPGSVSVKGAVHGFGGAGRGEFAGVRLPAGTVSAANITPPGVPEMRAKIFDEQVQFINTKKTPLARVSYTLRLADGSTHAGVTDDQGKTQRVTTQTPQAITHATLKPRALQSCCAVHAQNSTQAPEPLIVKITDITTNAQNVGSSVRQVSTPEGQSRGLTEGEIAMAQLIFKDAIDYSKVKVHNGEYFWFGMQDNDTAVTPNGEIYFNKKHFNKDFSLADFRDRHWFMHEMVHVWQYQLGYPVKWRGALRIGVGYEYTLAPEKRLSDYNMEAQGDIVADYFAHTELKLRWVIRQKGNQDTALIPLYRTVLVDFLVDPSNKKSLPR